MMIETQLLILLDRFETFGGGVNWYRLRHWDQEIAPDSVRALQALATSGHGEAIPERSPGWSRLTAKGRASLHPPNDE